jgi:hypothetical protein
MARTTPIEFTIQNAGTFFDNRSLLEQLQKFQAEVEEDIERYNRGVILGFATQFDIYGRNEFDRMFSAMVARDFGGEPKDNQLRMLAAMLDRHKGLWTQAIQKAFAVAQNSIEGKTQFGQPSIFRRIVRALFEGKREEEVEDIKASANSQLKGVIRTRKIGDQRVKFSINLTAHIQMLYKTNGMNFRRDFEMMVTRFGVSQKEGEQLYLINSHLSQVSSKTCRLCAGRVFTRESLRYAAQELSPNLFHPNCVHYVVKTFQQTTQTYDGKFGPVVDLKEIGRWISQGRTNRAKRSAPVSINV